MNNVSWVLGAGCWVVCSVQCACVLCSVDYPGKTLARIFTLLPPLLRFKGIPEDIIKKIEKKDFAWERFYDLQARRRGGGRMLRIQCGGAAEGDGNLLL